MTKIIEKTTVTIVEDQYTNGGTFENVEYVAVIHGVVEFNAVSDKQTKYIRTNRPFTIITTRTLSCGHNLESFRYDLNCGKFENERCVECDAIGEKS
jgi:hypothetical protein